MDPRLRTLIFGLIASIFAFWVGMTVAEGELFIATAVTAFCLWGILSWTRGPTAETWLLGFLFLGYVIGNRGFAQITPVSSLPIFFSELSLGVTLPLLALRGAIAREFPLRRDWLNGVLLLWLALGSGRIFWDIKEYGFMALRDFAMVYYLLYFFVTQALARHAASRRLLNGIVLVAFAILPLTGLLATVFSEFFLSNFLIDGVPLIFYKGDLLATFLFTGFIVLLPLGEFRWNRDLWRWLTAIASLLLGLALLSRASMVGLLVALGWLGYARCWRPARVVVAVCAAGLLCVTIYSLLQKKDFTQTNAYAIYEAVVSVGDVSGTHSYLSDQSSDKGDNNRFRLVWWRNVATETLNTSPLLGLGFGADLARGFLNEYYPNSEPDFAARSPHNIFMTTLGRMGLVGVAVLLSIYLVLGFSTARFMRAARLDPERRTAISRQAAPWVMMASACFGVVLEGPMGAIPFWILVALAYQTATAANEKDREARDEAVREAHARRASEALPAPAN